MARRQRRIVIGGAPVGDAPAIGRQRNQQIAELRRTEAEGAVADIGIGFGRAPRVMDGFRDFGWKPGEQAAIVVQGKTRLGGARFHRCQQLRRDLRRVGHAVARFGEIANQSDDAGRYVEPDGVSRPAGGAGIIRHQQRKLALRTRSSPQARQCGDPVRHDGDAVRLGPARVGGEGERSVARQRVLEGDGARENAPIELRQHHMHGEIGGAEPAGALPPRRTPRRGDHHLQHRRVDAVERGGLVLAARGEGRGGDDHRRSESLKRAAHECAGFGVFQARDHQRRRRQPACGQRRAQGIDRRGVGGEQRRAVEDDRHDGPSRRERGGKRIETDRALAGEIAGAARHGLGFGLVAFRPGMTGETAQQNLQILAPTFAEIREQRRKLLWR